MSRTVTVGTVEGPLVADEPGPARTRGVPPFRADTFAVWAAMIDALAMGESRHVMLEVDTIAQPIQADSFFHRYLASLGDKALYGTMKRAVAQAGPAPAVIDRSMLSRFTRYEVAPGRDRFSSADSVWLRRSGLLVNLYLSRVVFSPSRTLALVEGSWICGGLCGDAMLLLMERAPGGTWRCREVLMTAQF